MNVLPIDELIAVDVQARPVGWRPPPGCQRRRCPGLCPVGGQHLDVPAATRPCSSGCSARIVTFSTARQQALKPFRAASPRLPVRPLTWMAPIFAISELMIPAASTLAVAVGTGVP